ncbi:sulfatase [Nocardioides sp. NBC_00163]|uniref:sulfatase family protein n=1 Tax=Nocardioides sp. NBC_00163 TaxID=2975999 RepID=UPI00324A155D
MRPNLLWLVSEDCPPRFGCYGDTLARTPNLDTLAAESVLFERAYSPAPVCAPSRFALLTGVPPEAHAPANHMRARATLPVWMTTYPQVLRSLGYYCTNNSKTDYNADVDADELWDECSDRAHWRNRAEGQPFLAVFNIDGTHESAVFRAGRPVLDASAVRVPAYLPDTPEIRDDIARYYEDVGRMDAVVGELLAQLADDGLADSTVVVHTSDHGGVNPRSKRHCYEEGLRVPLLVHAPGRFAERFPPPGTRVRAAVTTTSIPATLIDLAGGTVPEHMSEPSLAGPVSPVGSLSFGARNRMDERYDFVRTVTDGRHRYVRNFMPHRPGGQYNAFAWAAAGYRSWESEHLAGRLTPEQDRFWLPRPSVELYDLEADPDQVVNRAGDPSLAEVEGRLATALREHMLTINDNGFLPEGAPAEGWDASRAPGAYDLAAVLELSDIALAQDPGNAPVLSGRLGDPDPLLRRWAAMGMLMLADSSGDVLLAGAVAARLAAEADATVQVVLAEALACLDLDDIVGIDALVRLAGRDLPFGVRLEALNALACLDPRRLRNRVGSLSVDGEDDDYLSQAIEYLQLRVAGRYEPSVAVGPWAAFFAESRAKG